MFVQQIEGYFLSPRLMAGATGLHPAAVILLVVFARSRKRKKQPALKMDGFSYPGAGNGETASSDKPDGGKDDGEKTAYSKEDYPDDGEKTTFGNQPGGSYNAMGNFSGENTTSPFSPAATDPFQQSMFGSADTAAPTTPDASAGSDLGEETLPVTYFDDNERTVPIQDEPGLKIKFRIETNGNETEKTVTVRNKITLGRGADCDVQINDKSVSKHHLEISLEPDGLYMKDLGSSNGTKVNGTSATGSVSLRTNDILELGYSKVTIEIQA